MPSTAAQPFHLYRTNTHDDVSSALVKLLKAKPLILGKKISGADKMYERLERLARTYAINAPENRLLRISQELINFIDVGLVDAFLSEPENPVFRDALALQIIMISTATGDNPRSGFKPYTPEELGAVLLGDVLYYDDIIFIRTLRAALDGVGNDLNSLLIVNSLPILEKAFADVEKHYEWDDAFIFGMMLQVAWKSFVFLGRGQQEQMLENYFYLGIVAGVPVREWLSEIFHTDGIDKRELSASYTRALQENRETIPTNTGVEEGRPLVDIMKDFLAKIYVDNIGALAESKFVQSFYTDQAYRESFTGWLRESMNIILHVKKGDI